MSTAMRRAIARVMEDTTVNGRKITVSEVVRRTKLSDNSVRRRISGEVAMDADYFEAICEALEVDFRDVWVLALRIRDTEPISEERELSPIERGAIKLVRKRRRTTE